MVRISWVRSYFILHPLRYTIPSYQGKSGEWCGRTMSTASGCRPFLRNKYWVLRHGKSIPNARGLIVSSLENGTLEEYKLAPDGVDQARSAGHSFRKALLEICIPLENVRICYSPFSRTCHTAKEVASVLDLPFDGPQCRVIPELRERFFGPNFELMSHDKYPEIWALDEKDPFESPEGGESVADVVSRLAKALVYIESEFQGCAVLIVSHGDPLQILQTVIKAALERPPELLASDDLESRLEEVKEASVLSRHREYAMLTGELRFIV